MKYCHKADKKAPEPPAPKIDNTPEPVRKSTRSTRWKGAGRHIINFAVGAALLLLPTHVMADSAFAPGQVQQQQLTRVPEETRQIDKSEKVEELRAYLTNLDRLEVLLNPTAEDDRWEIANI